MVPYHRTDLILRKVNLDRYDDRDFVSTNLIETYERRVDIWFQAVINLNDLIKK